MTAGPDRTAGPDLGAPTTLLLVRHGLTAHTGHDFTGGAGDEEPLDPRGLNQAEVVAAELDDRGLRGSAVLVTSPLRRTRETAAQIALGLELDVEPDDGWREIESLDETSIPGLVERVAEARDRLLGAHPGRTVVIVTHAGPVKALIGGALDAGWAALWRLRVDPCSISTVRYWADGGCEVANVNDTAHLL